MRPTWSQSCLGGCGRFSSDLNGLLKLRSPQCTATRLKRFTLGTDHWHHEHLLEASHGQSLHHQLAPELTRSASSIHVPLLDSSPHDSCVGQARIRGTLMLRQNDMKPSLGVEVVEPFLAEEEETSHPSLNDHCTGSVCHAQPNAGLTSHFKLRLASDATQTAPQTSTVGRYCP